VLKPAFRKDGSVTAGNAPGVNDGASALVLMSADRARALGVAPLARIVGQAASGLAPKMVLMTPVDATRKLMKKIGWRLEDVDLFELNEAFAVQAVAVIRELGLDAARVNVNGGAVASATPSARAAAASALLCAGAAESHAASRRSAWAAATTPSNAFITKARNTRTQRRR
jgi:acetyl-CoA C-acetyltransferase